MKTKSNSLKPWRCVILAIDPGKVSGVAIYSCGLLVSSGYVDKTLQHINYKHSEKHWCDVACAFSEVVTPPMELTGIPLIVVIEKPGYHARGGGHWGLDAYSGLQESVGVWKHYIEQLPKLKWKPKILRVPVDTWRKGIYGHCRAKVQMFDKKTRTLKPDSKDYWKQLACKTAGVEDNNEAEAILIGKYATHWWKVGEQAGVVTI